MGAQLAPSCHGAQQQNSQAQPGSMPFTGFQLHFALSQQLGLGWMWAAVVLGHVWTCCGVTELGTDDAGREGGIKA